MIDYTRELNEEQLAAVTAPDGPVLVIAAAGTGKTRTLVHRVAYLIERGVDPASILLLTFTNKAAKEMLERARELVGPTQGWPLGGTFHHVGNRILRRHAGLLGFDRGYTILDSDDQKRLAKQVYANLGLKGREFPQPSVLLSLFSYAANTQADVHEVLFNRFEHHPADIGDMLAVHKAYEELKRESAAMDFDDLLTHTLHLFDTHPQVLEEYHHRFHHVMVDEYQDTNALQAQMVNHLSSAHHNLLVVGDDFQSIYAWRGADFKNIMKFPEEHEGAEMFKLVTNYRSSPDILAVANAAIAHNPEQFQKELRAMKPKDSRPVVCELYDGQQQARYLVDQIQMMKREGYRYRDMAILYRTHYSSMEVDFELTRQNIPFVITSGVRFFEQAHVKDCCCLLQLVETPTNRLAFQRLLTLMPKVGDRTADKIWGKLDKSFDVVDLDQRELLKAALPKGARASWEKIDALLGEIERDHLRDTPSEIVQRFIDVFYDRYCLDNFENYERRIDNLRGLCDNIDQYPDLETFLSEMALQSNLDGDPAQEIDKTNAVKLSTIHQAKGLEWKVVFVIWLVEGLFPAGRSLEEDPTAAEERRLFYVAVTRAEDRLYLCTPKTRRQRDGGLQYYAKSRFLAELDANSVRVEHAGYI